MYEEDIKKIQDSPLLRMVENQMKKRFPWVKKLIVPKDRNPWEYSQLIFLTIQIDVDEFAKTYDIPLKSYVNTFRQTGGENDNMYASLATLIDIDNARGVAKKIEEELDKELYSPWKNKTALPDFLFQPLGGRKFSFTYIQVL